MMVAVVLTAVLLDRRALSLRSVSWAALAVLAIYPESLVGPSFQMSFLAVTALIALYEHYALQPHWRDRDGRWRLSHGLKVYVGGLVATDIVAGSVTSLLAAYHFSNLPAYSAIGNLVAAPITGLWIMPWGLIGLALMPLGFDAGALGLMGVGIDGLNRLAAAIATWPSAQVHVPPMSMAALTAAALGVLFVSLWRGAWRWIGLAPILFAVAQPWAARPPDLLVAPDGGLLAVTDDAGALVMSPGRNERFVRSVWIERFGRGPARWPDASGLRCDSNGCVLDRNGARTTVAFTRDAVVEDCGRSRLIVAPDLFVDDCRGSVVVDRRDVLRDGAHAFTLDGGQVSIDSVRDHIGTRRWNRDLGPRRPIPISSGGTDPPDDPGP
jgi:competence protein ComEC